MSKPYVVRSVAGPASAEVHQELHFGTRCRATRGPSRATACLLPGQRYSAALASIQRRFIGWEVSMPSPGFGSGWIGIGPAHGGAGQYTWQVTTATPARLDLKATAATMKAQQTRCPQEAESVSDGVPRSADPRSHLGNRFRRHGRAGSWRAAAAPSACSARLLSTAASTGARRSASSSPSCNLELGAQCAAVSGAVGRK